MNLKKFLVGINVVIWSFVGYQVAHAETKPAPKVDCTQKKNEGKIECKAPPKSDAKPEIKKPEKVQRKAPADVKKKADANNK